MPYHAETYEHLGIKYRKRHQTVYGWHFTQKTKERFEKTEVEKTP